MTTPYRLTAVGDLELKSGSSHVIKHVNKSQFDHEHNSLLKDLTDLKENGVSDGHILQMANGVLSSVSVEDFATQLPGSESYITSVGANLDVTGGELTVDLSSKLNVTDAQNDYLQIADQYITSVGSDLTVSGGQLTVNFGSLVDTVTAQQTYLAIVDEYITSVGSDLAVSGGQLTVDFGNLLTSDTAQSTYLAIDDEVVKSVDDTNLELSVDGELSLNPDLVLNSGSVKFTNNNVYFSKTSHFYKQQLEGTNTYYMKNAVQLTTNQVFIKGRLFVNAGSTVGVVERSGVYTLDAPNAVLVEGTDNLSVTGNVDGGTLRFANSGSSYVSVDVYNGLSYSGWAVLDLEVVQF